MSDIDAALASVSTPAKVGGGSAIDEALGSLEQSAAPTDIETARESIAGLVKPALGTEPGTFEYYKQMGRQEFLESNPLVNLGAWVIKKVTGQRTEGQGADLGPALKPAEPTFSESLAAGVEFFKERPLTATAELAKGLLYSPELAIASVARGPQALGRLAELAEAGKRMRAVAAAGDVALQGGVVLGADAALRQAAQTEGDVEWGQVGAQATLGAGGVLALKGAGKVWRMGRGEKPGGVVETPTLDRFQETVELGTGEIRSPAEAAYRQPSPLTEPDAILNARTKAYDLMQRGASKKTVEAAIKRDPQIGVEMEKLRAGRGEAKESFNRAIQGEVLPPEKPGLSGDVQELQQIAQGKGPLALEGPVEMRPTGAPRSRQSGEVDPKFLALVGLGTAGALGGAYLAGDSKVAGAVLGGAGAVGLASLPRVLSGLGRTLSVRAALGDAARIGAVIGTGAYLGNKSGDPVMGAAIASAVLLGVKALPKARALSSDDLIAARNGSVAAQERITANLKRDIDAVVPEGARRIAISEALDRGSPAGLVGDEVKVYGAVRKFFDDMGREAKDADVISGMRENYISYIVERDPAMAPEEFRGILDRMFSPHDEAAFSTKSRFGKHGKYETFAEINNALKGSGLRLKTQDVGEIMTIYSRSMRRAIENKVLLDNLKTAKTPEGIDLLVKFDKNGNLPQGYKTLGHPQLRGYGIHPELMDSMKVVFGSQDHNVVTRGLLGLSMATKRLNVFGSLFHAKSLGEVYINAAGRDVYTKGLSPINQALAMFRKGGLGDTMDLGIRHGLMMEIPHDVSRTIISDAGHAVDRLIPRLTGFAVKPGEAVTAKVDWVNGKLDAVTWDYCHTGIKGTLFLKEFETMMLRNAEAHARNPKVPLKSREQIAAEVAKYANDLTGGLDWFRIAIESKTQLGRQLGLFFAGPQGRAFAQIIAFAPDWAVSTLRAGFKAFGKSDTGLKGILRPENVTDLYRKYALRSALYWLTLLNGMNYAFTGRMIWTNKDPTRIDLGDGTSVQAGKHTFEAVHAVMDPVRFAYNKLGYPTKMTLDFFSGKEGFGDKAPPYKSFVGHAAEAALPFTAQSASQQGLSGGEKAKRAVLSSVGLPQYGYTAEQKALARKERAADRREKRRRELGLD